MALFQTSVLKQYINLQELAVVEKAYRKYQKYFLNPTIQENIKSSKEEQFQATFLTELFVNILGYTINPSPNYNITTEFKNQKNARKADGAILKDTQAIGVIELKGTKTKDLESIRRQAFDYKANQKGCVYVVTSNFEKLRFYINDATEFEEFNLFELSQERFQLLYLCLYRDNILTNLPLSIKEASIVEEEKITKSFYSDYSVFKRELFRDLVKRNAKRLKSEASTIISTSDDNIDAQAEITRLEKNVKLTLFKKSQKLIDRFLFIFFAEDRTLLPSNSTLQILNKWKDDWDFGDERPLYQLFKQYFNFLDIGRKGTEKRAEIYAYNGGLFKPDALLDNLEIDNDLLYKYTLKLANYDFESQVDVNILGHIFENSLNEIESVNAEIEGGDFDKQKSKRKKDGVFYTPKYITKYIVENTVGKLCEEKKAALGFAEEEYFKGRKNRNKATIEKLVSILDDYREWLLQITICDPACGSGAFLNQALDFLIKEHTYIDELKAKVLGGGLQFPDIENTILENNIYGVDLNEESVEIAKLSLWLRTAQPRRKLNDLSSNIKCGNSLIDNKSVAGDKAFNWETAFAKVFEKGGFDVIIGNPPYVSSKDGNFSDKEKDYYLKIYDTSVYQIDLYILFIEKCAHLIQSKGIISLIIPNAWLNNIFLSPVRKKILDEYKLYEFVDMPSNTFIDANVDTVIVNYGFQKREKETDILYFDNAQIFEKFSSTQEDWLKEDNFIINLSVNKSILNCLKKIERNALKLSEVSRIGRGVGLYHKRVGHTKEFISKDPFQSNIEKDSTFKPYIKGKNITRWAINWQNDGFISYGKWLAEPREIDFFEGSRILLRQIPSKLLYATEIDELFITDQSVFIAKFQSNSKFCSKSILGIINSKLMSFYFRYKYSEFDDLFPKVKLQHFKDFPITKSNTVLLENVLKVQRLSKQLISQKYSFQRFILSSFKLFKLSRKLENWHELDFGEFIKELNKAIKANNKERLKQEQEAIATLTKLDEMDWMDAFNTKRKEAQGLQTQITQTEAEIDQMVYKLYGLTQDEIDIIENV